MVRKKAQHVPKGMGLRGGGYLVRECFVRTDLDQESIEFARRVGSVVSERCRTGEHGVLELIDKLSKVLEKFGPLLFGLHLARLQPRGQRFLCDQKASA